MAELMYSIVIMAYMTFISTVLVNHIDKRFNRLEKMIEERQ